MISGGVTNCSTEVRILVVHVISTQKLLKEERKVGTKNFFGSFIELSRIGLSRSVEVFD